MKIQCIPMKDGWTCVRLSEDESGSSTASSTRCPVHLCCVIDTSGSMSEYGKIVYVKQSLQFFLESLTAEDQMTVITFDLEVETLVQRLICDADGKSQISAKIQTIQAHGGTNLCAGLMEAEASLLPFDSRRKQGILLLTDGEATHGHVTTHAILDRIQGMFEKYSGTSVSCIGYGTNHNVELLRRMSEKYAGSYYVVQHATDVPVVFGDIMGGLLSIRSQRIHLQLDRVEEVRSAYPITRVGQNRDVYVGDLPAGKEAAVMVRARPASLMTVGYDPMGAPHVAAVVAASAAASGDDEKITAELHSLRYSVVELMNEALDQSHLSNEAKNSAVERINEFKERIQGLKSLMANPLWGIMLEELDHLHTYLTEPARCCTDFQQVLIQRAGCLAMLRGVGASASNQYASQIPAAIRLTPSMSCGYSNALQQSCSAHYTQSFDSMSPPPPGPLPSLGHSLSIAPGAPPPFPLPSLSASPSLSIIQDSQDQDEDLTQPGAI